ncbi:hypothetical protein C8J57DRAFT_1311295 [Mycena rebaudengoi]|nr:hypothetical protein C8J57DRAFT_1365376 [Mycena rebaudengoi]KAJ7275641.1 hypothetical protein C8J57DRAFT_1311295 [Mycena rebaudengoi]
MVVGVYLLGLLFNTFLYGLVLAQFLTYFNTKSNDPSWIRAVVWSLLLTDTIHSAVEVYAVWETGCVPYFSLIDSILIYTEQTVSWAIPFTAVATSVAAIITQLFLVSRVMLLTKNRILMAVICTLSFVGLVFGCTAGIMSGVIKEVAKFGPLVPYVILWLSFQSLADFLITASLITALLHSRTGFRRTDTIINRLVRGAIETGLFASAFALADLFSFVFFRDTNLYAMFAFPIGRIYTNTLLHTLNARAELNNMDSIIDCNSEGNAAVIRTQDQSKIQSTTFTETVLDHQGRSPTSTVNKAEKVQVHVMDDEGNYRSGSAAFAFLSQFRFPFVASYYDRKANAERKSGFAYTSAPGG